MVSISKFLLISLFLAIGALWVAFGERNASEPKPGIPNQPAVTVPQVGHLSPPNDLRRETLAQLMREALSNPDSLDGTRPEAGLSSSAGDAMAQVSPTPGQSVATPSGTDPFARSSPALPSFEAVLTDGSTFDLDATRGSPTLLIFWAPW